jgi:hypothetical protein
MRLLGVALRIRSVLCPRDALSSRLSARSERTMPLYCTVSVHVKLAVNMRYFSKGSTAQDRIHRKMGTGWHLVLPADCR